MVNMTNVVLKSHPDTLLLSSKSRTHKFTGRALVIPSDSQQHGITSKARFHILKNSEKDLGKVMNEGDFTEYESAVFASSTASILVLRTSLTIEGVDFYREAEYIYEDKIFIYPVYLQEKTLNITDVSFNITGRIIRTHDPLNVYLQNISFDSYRISVFYSDVQAL